MMKVPTWQLVLLFFYSCTAVPATMFMLSLVFQWILVPGFDVDFFGYEQVYVALKMAVIGFFVGICLWLSGNDSNLLIVFYVQIMPDD
ncbi:hypothetical protein, partial [Klebsiella pneumoniae]